MSERHTAGGQQHQRVAAGTGDARSVMARASDLRPFRPYAYGGEAEEPPAVTAARERHRAVSAEIERVRAAREAEIAAAQERYRAAQALAAREETMPDPAPGWEWYRELAEDGELAEVTAVRDRYQDALTALDGPPEPEPLPAPPIAADGRCGRCGYLTTAAGHKVTCGE